MDRDEAMALVNEYAKYIMDLNDDGDWMDEDEFARVEDLRDAAFKKLVDALTTERAA